MIYAVLQRTNQRKRGIERLVVVENPITAIAQLQALPAFEDEEIDWQLEDMVEIPDEIDAANHYVYDTETGTFEPAQPERQIFLTRLQLLNRLLPQEKVLLIRPDKVSGLSDEIEIALSIFATEIQLAEEINLDDPAIVQGLTMLEQAGLIGAGRGQQIRGLDATSVGDE
ncbi:MAG: hypothetical protein CR975_02130 [Gammaproteobacteria bacterium]|nr:MAG: hypothetical protein CR975_02130 [Gammaproteobacteria bacterium]